MTKIDFVFIPFIVILASIVGFYIIKSAFIDKNIPELMVAQPGETTDGGVANLVKNGSFDANFSDWERINESQDTAFSIDSLWDVCRTGPTARLEVKNNLNQGMFLKQGIKLKPNTNYFFSIDIFSQSGLLIEENNKLLEIFFSDNNGHRIDFITQNGEKNKRKDGYCNKYNTIINSGINELDGNLYIGGKSKGTFWFDNIKLERQN